MNKTMISILKILEKKPDLILGSREISRQLLNHGIELTERTVRYHMRILDEKGFTTVHGREGRRITSRGREELSHSLVSERIGFVHNKMETLTFLSDFDIAHKRGKIILNVTFFPLKKFREAVRVMQPVFNSKYIMSDRVITATEGEYIGDVRIPEGCIGFGTVCSVTINSILFKAGIPIASKFGGVLQIEESEPSRFIALISYQGSSLDPLEIFIKSSMTAVRNTVKTRSGNILASYREIPMVCVEKVRELRISMEREGIGGILAVGSPNQDLLEMPVAPDKAGIVVVGGLNPVAAAGEAGITSSSRAMSALYEYAALHPFSELQGGGVP